MVRLSVLFEQGQRFRETFHFPNKHLLQWFPGHMGKGMKQIQQKLKSVDCIVEVHDARIPISGRNAQFQYTVGRIRPHILVLNKMDLADTTRHEEIRTKLNREAVSEVLYTNCKDLNCNGLKKLVPTITRLIGESDRYNRAETKEFGVMVIGVPNVGKSSIINAIRSRHLRRAKAAAVGAIAGITRSVQSKIKVCSDPLIYVLDTPGILDPKVDDVDTAFKLALCSSMKDDLIGIKHIANYLLYFLNKREKFDYIHLLKLPGPSDSIEEVLLHTAVSMGKTVKVKDISGGGYRILPDIDTAGYHFVKLFRNGDLGKFMLDDL